MAFAGGPGGVGRTGGGAVAGGASGIGGRGIGGGGNAGKVNGGPLNEQQAQTRAAFAKAVADFNDTNNSTLGNIGNSLAGMAGFGEIDPATQGLGAFDPRQNKTVAAGGPAAAQADWGYDFGGGLAGLAGMATGMPLGLGYTALTKLGKWAGLVDPSFGIANLGPDVFGGAPSAGGTYGGSSGAPSAGGVGIAGGGANSPGMNGARWGAANAQMAARPGLLSQTQAPAAGSAPAPSPGVGPAGSSFQQTGMLGPYNWNSRFGQGALGQYRY